MNWKYEDTLTLAEEAKRAVLAAQKQWQNERAQLKYNRFIKSHYYPIQYEL